MSAWDFESQSLETRILYGDDFIPREDVLYSDDILTGAGFNDPALVAMAPQSPSDAGWSFQSIMDAIGNLGQTARDIGTVVGTAERDIKSVSGEYQTARNNAKTGNRLGQWWDYAPTTEKVMVGIGLAGLALVVYQIARGK